MLRLSSVLLVMLTLAAIPASAQGVPDRGAQPIKPPVLTFPSMAAEQDLPGACDVRFDVDLEGYPVNITASCSDAIFCSESKRAISRVIFEPKLVDDEPVMRFDVVLPLEYQLEKINATTGERVSRSVPPGAEKRPCEEVAVS